jgi:hypothetical protein
VKNNISLSLLASMFVTCSTEASFIAQGSFSLQVNDSIVKLSGYDVKYTEISKSPYDLSVGYLFSFRDVVVVPVMVEGKLTTLQSYFNTEEMEPADLAPLEVLLKPGLQLTSSDVYMILGYQLGDFKQKVDSELHEHSFELKVNPTFYGAGYASALSDYMDYVVEAKVYYQSGYSYGFDFSDKTFDPDLSLTDAKVRLGLRLKF